MPREPGAGRRICAQYTTSASVEDLEADPDRARVSSSSRSSAVRTARDWRWSTCGATSRASAPSCSKGPVTPANHVPEHFGQLAARALDGLLDECLADAECARAFPAIREEARQVFDRACGRKPADRHRLAPVGRGRPGTVTLTRDHVAEAIRYLTYSSARCVARAALSARRVQRRLLADRQLPHSLARRGTFDGLYLSITCAEDVPLVARGAAETDDPTFLGGYRVRQQRAACAVWPRGTRPTSSVSPSSRRCPSSSPRARSIR